jgi:hypothetical protein
MLFIDRVASLDDLYHVREGENGELLRVPLSNSAPLTSLS